MTIGNLEHRMPEETKAFSEGYKACFDNLNSIVKRLGKKHYKEFIDSVKDINPGLVSFTIASHKCNCGYCSWDTKED